MTFDLLFRSDLCLGRVRAMTRFHELNLILLLLGFCSFAACPVGAQQSPASLPGSEPTTTFLVVRHADRDGERDALTESGQARAEMLRELCGILNTTAVYSTNFERTKNTALPAAEAKGLKVQIYEQPTADWLGRIRVENRGGVILIVGHSNTVGEIVKQLSGESIPEILHDEYDHLFIISVRDKLASLVRLRYGSGNKGTPASVPDKMGPQKKGG